MKGSPASAQIEAHFKCSQCKRLSI